jgi:hypothetical protein
LYGLRPVNRFRNLSARNESGDVVREAGVRVGVAGAVSDGHKPNWMGAELVNARGCQKLSRVAIERLTNKTEPEGAGLEQSGPLLSVRKVG